MLFGLASAHPRRSVRLDTLVRLRWLAVIGQTIALLVVEYGLDFVTPFWPCLAVIALSAAVNIVVRVRLHATQRLEADYAAWLLAFDVAQLAALLFLTGGLQNPFAFLFLSPVLFSATALPPRYTLLLGGFVVACATFLVFAHLPLPWDEEDPLLLPPLYTAGVWLSIVLAIGFTGAYAWQITEESRQLSDALAATELVLAHEQHLSQLDGLAAAAAHELGTPMSTISVIARELERAIPADSPHAEDVKLLREQAARCREILGKLTELSSIAEPFQQAKLSTLIEEVVSPHRHFDIQIDVTARTFGPNEPDSLRNPAIIYGLGNLIENAVDFARERVGVETRWDDHIVSVTISDDGPGFAPEVIGRLGEPYVTTRGRKSGGERDAIGLGLGLFIAKTLLERSGAALTFANKPAPQHGTIVTVRWPRADFESKPNPAVIA